MVLLSFERSAMGSESSSDEDDEEQIARLQSVAVDSSAVMNLAAAGGHGLDRNGAARRSKRKKKPDEDEDDFNEDRGLNHCQIRVQNLLHQRLDKSLGASFVEVETEPIALGEKEENEDFDGEVRLFHRAPLGINLKRPEYPKQIGRPKRYDSSDEDEPERISRFQAAAVDGTTLLSHAERARGKARARANKALEAAKKAEIEEKQRVAKLRKERGEEWLPKIASELRREQKLIPSSNGQVGRVMDI